MSIGSDVMKVTVVAAGVTFGPTLVYASGGDEKTAGHFNDTAGVMANTIQSSSTSVVAADNIVVRDPVKGGEIRYLIDPREFAGVQMSDVSSGDWWRREKP